MKKIIFTFITLAVFFTSSNALAKTTAKPAPAWKPITPEGYKPITWASARGVATFMKAPTGNGYLDYLTVVYLPYNQVKFVASSTPKLDWGIGRTPFNFLLSDDTSESVVSSTVSSSVSATATATTTTSTVNIITTTPIHDWAFAKMMVENAKDNNPSVKFFWNVPFFNVEIPTTDLSMSLKSTDALGAYITSGSRPDNDIAQPRRMLVVNNLAGTSTIKDFDENIFVSDGDQAVEGFDPTITIKGAGSDARLFLGVKPNGKELVVYCSQGATPLEASEALLAAGVPVENQLQADGGSSATCAYNMPGQYFVEPGRTLPHLMGAQPIVGRGVVTKKLLEVRSGAGTKNKIIKKLPIKTPVVIFESKSGWLRISNNSEWVLATAVKQALN